MNKILLLVLLASFLVNCQQETNHQTPSAVIHTISGETMGTYYRVRYIGDEVEKLQEQLDSLLLVLDFELSTYNSKSVISNFNQGEKFQDIVVKQSTGHFIKNIDLASEIYQKTKGYFDPSVMPIVNYWGFGYDPSAIAKTVDSIKVDSILQLIGFEKINIEDSGDYWSIEKEMPAVQIDLSAIAKGYGVDQLAQFLRKKGIKDYLVDIGGEVVGEGQKAQNNPWRIGVATPEETADVSDYMAAVPVENTAIATSGNYRNFHEIDGVKYSHTINPFTGYPERSRLLSASVMASDCATADAFATACMVAGLDNGFEMIDTIPELEGFFIYSDDSGQLLTKATDGFPAVEN